MEEILESLVGDESALDDSEFVDNGYINMQDAPADGYEAVRMDQGYVLDAGYVLGEFGGYSGASEDAPGDGGDSAAHWEDDDASMSLFVGSGRFTGINALLENEHESSKWSSQFRALQRTSYKANSEVDVCQHLTAILDIPEDRADRAVRKYSLALEVVHSFLSEIQAVQPVDRNRQLQYLRETASDPVQRFANVIDALQFKLRMHMAVLMTPQAAPSPKHTFGGVREDCRARLASSSGSGGDAHAPVYERYLGLQQTLTLSLGKLKNRRHDWNDMFQAALDLREDSPAAKLQKYTRLSSIAKDFTYAAETYGRVIINELYLPSPLKTIAPSDVGGVGGGTKFMSHGILFKLAVDRHGLYGGDEFAQKAAGHDLKALMAIFDCRIAGLHIPLSCIIDYRGFRVLASALLPVDDRTIVYGSSDGGRTVHDDSPTFAKMMKEGAQRLGLAGHLAGIREQRYLYTPCDIEGHAGKDGRFYLLDFARTFPPETPRRANIAGLEPEEADVVIAKYRGAHLYRLLRPELVRVAPSGPLSSDVFCGFGGNNAGANAKVVQATRHLLTQVIPEFAAHADKSSMLGDPERMQERLSQLLHRSGINVRYMGLVRCHATDAVLRSVLLLEMVSRVVKDLIRAGFRATQDVEGMPTEEPYRRFAISHLNLLLGQVPDDQQEAHERYWSEVKRMLLVKFSKRALESYERKGDFDLRKRCDVVRVLLRLERLTGIRLTEAAKVGLRREPENFIVVDSDIESIESRVKSLNVVEISSAIALSMQAVSVMGRASERLFALSFEKFEAAANASPSNVTTFRYWGSALFSQALILDEQGYAGRARDLLTQAYAKYNAIAETNKTHRESLIVHANISRHLASRAGEPDLAALLFCRAFELGAAAGETELLQQCVTQVLQFSRRLGEYADPKSLLMPVRLALSRIGGWEARGDAAHGQQRHSEVFGDCRVPRVVDCLRSAFNLVCVEIFHSSKVLDMDVCEDLARQLEDDGVALAQLAGSASDKFISWRPEGVALPLRLMHVFDGAIESLRRTNDAKLLRNTLHQRGDLALLVAWSNIPHIAQVREAALLGAENLRECGAAASLAANAVKLLGSFFAENLFVEDPVKQFRQSCALSEFTSKRHAGCLGWDSANQCWVEHDQFCADLAERESLIANLSARMLRYACELDSSVITNDVVAELPSPMLACVLDSEQCDEALRGQLASVVSSITIGDNYGMSASSLTVIANTCTNVRLLHVSIEELCLEASSSFSNIEMLHLNALSNVTGTDVRQFMEGNARLKELHLPGRCDGLVALEVVPHDSLSLLSFAGKCEGKTLVEFLQNCPELRQLEFSKRGQLLHLSRLPSIPFSKTPESLLEKWGRSFAVSLSASHAHRYFGKMFFRGALPRDHHTLGSLLSKLHLINGQPNNTIIRLLQKLGPEILDQAIATYIENKEYAELFTLLIKCDKWDNYDPGTTLGMLVFSMRRRLMKASPEHFRSFLKVRSVRHIPSLLESLADGDVLAELLEYFQKVDMQLLLWFSNSLQSLLLNANANRHVVQAAAMMINLRMDDEGFVEQMISELRAILRSEEHRHPAMPTQAYLLLLVVRHQPAVLQRLSEELAAVRCFRIVNIPRILDAWLIRKLVSVLPPQLQEFSIRYSSRLTEEIDIDDALLGEIAARFPQLRVLELDLAPALSNGALETLVRRCPDLRVLQVRSHRVDDRGIDQLAALRRLRVLRIECKTRDLTLSRLASQLESLVSIDLFGCPYITLHGIEKIVANAEKLRELRVGSCRQVNIDMLKQRQMLKIMMAKDANANADCSVQMKSGVAYKNK